VVGLGGAVGGSGRYWISNLIANRFGQAFPWGASMVNKELNG
jgi:CrcB protein